MRARYNGPRCGKRYRVNSLFDSAAKFFTCTIAAQGKAGVWKSWVGDPKWHGRLKALKRSRQAHGQDTDYIGLLVKIAREWEASYLS